MMTDVKLIIAIKIKTTTANFSTTAALYRLQWLVQRGQLQLACSFSAPDAPFALAQSTVLLEELHRLRAGDGATLERAVVRSI